MTTRNEQHQEGEGDGVKHPHSQRVGLHVVNGDEWLVMLPHKPLTELQTDAQTQGQARLHCGGYSRELAWPNTASLQSLLDHALYVFSVKVLCYSGNDATSPAVFKTEAPIKTNYIGNIL